MIHDAAATTATGELDGGMVEGRAIKVTGAKPREKRSNSDRRPSFVTKATVTVTNLVSHKKLKMPPIIRGHFVMRTFLYRVYFTILFTTASFTFTGYLVFNCLIHFSSSCIW